MSYDMRVMDWLSDGVFSDLAIIVVRGAGSSAAWRSSASPSLCVAHYLTLKDVFPMELQELRVRAKFGLWWCRYASLWADEAFQCVGNAVLSRQNRVVIVN